jgi:hypothetical protein
MTRRPVLTPGAVVRLTTVTDPWLSCDDCFDALDVVVEDVLARGAAVGTPFAVHLTGCSVCNEEAQSLAALIAPENGLDSNDAQRVLEVTVRVGAG